MTKKCLHEGEKSAPFLRQKPAKNALFSSILPEKVGRNKKAKCSFLILVDYTFVLNLDKVASVKH